MQRRKTNDLYKWSWITHHNITAKNAARIDSVPGPVLKALFFNFISPQNKYIRSICYLHFPEAQISIAACSVPHGEISQKQFMCQLENSNSSTFLRSLSFCAFVNKHLFFSLF